MRYFKIPKGTKVVDRRGELSSYLEDQEVGEGEFLDILTRAVLAESHACEDRREMETKVENLRNIALGINLATCTLREIYRKGGSEQRTQRAQKYCDDCAQLLPHYGSCPAEGTGD